MQYVPTIIFREMSCEPLYLPRNVRHGTLIDMNPISELAEDAEWSGRLLPGRDIVRCRMWRTTSTDPEFSGDPTREWLRNVASNQDRFQFFPDAGLSTGIAILADRVREVLEYEVHVDLLVSAWSELPDVNAAVDHLRWQSQKLKWMSAFYDDVVSKWTQMPVEAGVVLPIQLSVGDTYRLGGLILDRQAARKSFDGRLVMLNGHQQCDLEGVDVIRKLSWNSMNGVTEVSVPVARLTKAVLLDAT